MTMFQFDLDKLRNYLWYCYEKQWCLLEVGIKRAPKSFDLLKIWDTSLKIHMKMAPNLAWLQNMAPKICRKSHEDLSWGHTKKGLHDLRWREFVGQSCTKNFSWKFGKIQAKILRHTKNFPAPKPVMKRHLRPRCSPFERRGMNAPAMPPSSGVPVHINLHALSSLVVVGYNLSL